MSFLTFKSVIYALIVIVFIHFLISVMLKNEKKYKNNSIKILKELPQNEENNSKDTNQDINRDMNKDINKDNISFLFENKKNEKKIIKEDFSNMKQDILSFLENNNDIYNHDTKNSDNNELPSFDNKNMVETTNFSNKNTGLDNFFKNSDSTEYNYEQPKKKVTIQEPQINLQTKEKIYIDSDTLDNPSCVKPDVWKYQDENIMNGGEMSGGLTAWDNTDNGLAIYEN